MRRSGLSALRFSATLRFITRDPFARFRKQLGPATGGFSTAALPWAQPSSSRRVVRWLRHAYNGLLIR